MYMNNSVENKRKSDSQKLCLNFFYRKFINQNAFNAKPPFKM